MRLDARVTQQLQQADAIGYARCAGNSDNQAVRNRLQPFHFCPVLLRRNQYELRLKNVVRFRHQNK